MRNKQSWYVPSSIFTKRCKNPIRAFVEGLAMCPNPDKSMIALSIGDPTLFGNLKTAHEVADAVVESVRSFRHNGYAPSTGYEASREAVAKYLAQSDDETLTARDVIICSGCSHALEMCITVLANPGQNILVPRPGFPIYKMVAECMGVETRFYDLMPDKNWEVDLPHLDSLIDRNTAAIIVNNPSNPCGSVFSKEHLLDILHVAARHFVPIIADEVYENFVFGGQAFYTLGSLSEDVPILSCGGLTKRFLVPGWRLGWIAIHDRHKILEQEIRPGLLSLSQRIMGSNTVVQGALPTILSKTPGNFFTETVAKVEANAILVHSILSKTPGVRPIMPSGAMYIMVGLDMECFPEFKNDKDLVERMISEQSVMCLPGMLFEMPGFLRLVLTLPEEMMVEACGRINEFCVSHYQGRLPSEMSISARVMDLNGLEPFRLDYDRVHVQNGFQIVPNEILIEDNHG